MWPIFAALRRTLSGGRNAPAPPPADGAFPLEAEWAGLLANLQLPPHALREVLANGSLEPHFRYQRFTKPKKNGKRREISEPDAKLKRLQQEIIARYFAIEPTHAAAVAYQSGKSTADHIWAHAGAEVIVVADIQDFFPNTHAHRIEAWWRGRTDDATARLLTLLTTDRGGLPQGAPTSPALSNTVNRELDTHLAQRAAIAGARYTRYCDDLAFSWPVGFGPPSGFESGVRRTLHEFGYALHPAKGWRVYDRRDEPEVTGAILTRHGGVRLPERIRKVMRKLARSAEPGDSERLAGYEGYEEMVTRSPKRRRKKKKKHNPAKAPALPPQPQGSGEWVPAPRSKATEEDEDIPF